MGARRWAVAAATTATATVSATVLATLGALPASAVSTDQSYWVPVDKRIVVRGHGYGHGHGMSQYGAEGAAAQGLSYKEIVDFYYPGTQWSEVGGRVRVLITGDTSDDVVVAPVAGLAVRDLGSGATYTLPTNAAVTRWRLNVRQGKTVLERLSDRWRIHRTSSGNSLAGDGEFFARSPLTLFTPSGTKRYRGILRAASPTPGAAAKNTVNIVSMDQYVMGVVPYEMPASWHPEAVRAQAVAARTYATWSREQNVGRYYQICDTTSCQVYGGASGEDARANDAVRATARQILTYRGRPAFTQFSSSSGGWTSAGSVPYLVAKEDPYDGWDGNPVHDWTMTVDTRVLERRYPSIGVLGRIRVVGRDGNGEWQGRVTSLVLDGSTGDVTISGDSFRWAYGLRSNWFSIDPTPIIDRWARIGGARSTVGPVVTVEYAVGAGAGQRFERGRIFYLRRTGARELYGPILYRYQQAGGPASVLGFPRTSVRVLPRGSLVRFQHGMMLQLSGRRPVTLTGAIEARFVAEGGLTAGLGWPLRGNYSVAVGERADFEHGHIVWNRSTGATRVVRTAG